MISPVGAPAALVLGWFRGQFELVVSEQLLEELARAFTYPKLRARVSEADAGAFVQLLRTSATMAVDPANPAARSRDAGDDYLLALAESNAAVLVSGDPDLLALADRFPVMSPAAFLQHGGE